MDSLAPSHHDDGASETPRALVEPFVLEHALCEHLPELARVATRRRLERSELYRSLRPHIDEVTRGMEFGKHAERRLSGPNDTLHLVAWNIQRGRRLGAVTQVLATEPKLKDADVLLLLECDVGMARSGNENVAREIACRLGYDYVFGNSYLCLSGGNERELVRGRGNTLALSGNAILSRLPLLRAENVSMAITKDKFESSEKRLGHKKALWAEVRFADRPVAVAAVHLDSAASSSQRARQLSDVVRTLSARGVAECSVLGGDFNTSTYDAINGGALLCNLAVKLWRGGFPHAIHHYLFPELLYERAVFDVLIEAGYDFTSYNRLGVGTLRYQVGDADSEGRVRDFLPQPFVDVLRRKLEPYGGEVALKLDWFAGRGFRVVDAGSVTRPRVQGLGVSDHDPIWVKLTPSKVNLTNKHVPA